MEEETLEIHSKDFLIKWIDAPDNSIIDWQITPLKKSINFAIYKKHDEPNSGVDVQDSLEANGESGHRNRSESLSSVLTGGIVRTKSRSSTFSSIMSDLTLVKNYYKLVGSELVHGKLDVQQGGMFAFVFDNTFSKTVAKKVEFCTKIDTLGASTAASITGEEEGDPGFENIETSNSGESLQGVLMKRKRKKLQGFTKRFFILSFKYGTLSYFKVNDNKLRGQMPIKQSMISANAKNKEIVIDSGMEIWDLKALDEDEFNTWVDAFNKIKKQQDMFSKPSLSKFHDEEDGTQYVLDELEDIVTKLDDLRITTEKDYPDIDNDVNDIYEHVCDLIDQINPPVDENGRAIRRDSQDESGVVFLDDQQDDDFYSDEYSDDYSDRYDDRDDASSFSEDDDYSNNNKQLHRIDESDEVESRYDEELQYSKAENDDDLYPLPHDPVQRNPEIPACDHQPPSILGFVRKNIGKDLSTIAMPVDMNEPLTLLQRFSEVFEYTDLLENTLEGQFSDDSGEKILRIASFALTYMSTVREKERNNRKPFNPLLGETFELVREDFGIRMIAEKVSHRPPVFAFHADAKNWTYTYSPSPNQTFWGKNAEIVTKGVAKLTVKSTGETFTWEAPTTLLKNIIAGEKYTEPSTEMIVKSSSGTKAVVEFAKGGMFSGRSEDLVIKAFDLAKKQLSYTVTGKWTESFTLKTHTAEKTIWQVGNLLQPPKKKFGFTEFAGTLNKITPIEKGKLAPTDSRLRPDLIAYEKGDVESAEALKQKLEEDQRTRRKEVEESGGKHEPLFFTHVGGTTPDSGEWVVKTGPKSYWNRRKNGDWDDLPQLW
jgi:hypothetical protein